MMKKQKHWNEHRKDKKSFQAMLTKTETKLVDSVKELRGFETARDILLTLCREELIRNEKETK